MKLLFNNGLCILPVFSLLSSSTSFSLELILASNTVNTFNIDIIVKYVYGQQVSSFLHDHYVGLPVILLSHAVTLARRSAIEGKMN